MSRLQLQIVLMLLSAAAAALQHVQSQSPAAGPVQRRIVTDLSPALIEQLEEADIGLLMVLSGPKGHNSMKLDWRNVTGSVKHLIYVADYQEFLVNWRQLGSSGFHRWQFTPTNSLRHGAFPKTALLIRGEDGTAHISQLTLAASIMSHLQRPQLLTCIYSTHQAKGDSLLVLDGTGVPLQANFLATSIFRDAFTSVYNTKFWSAEGGGSGQGSTMEFTANIRAALPGLIEKYGINSMLDSSCGSMHWMLTVLKEVWQQKPGFKFMGTDVVCSLIDKHMQTYKDHPNMNFQCVDYANQPLPSGYDFVFSRDSLQHIPMHGAWQFLNNVKATGAKYLLVGSYINSKHANMDVTAGEGYYDISLLKEPFNLSEPLEIIDEKSIDGKHMLLFDVQKMTWEDSLAGFL